MKHPGIALALCTAVLAMPAHGKTLRWASQGDPKTADPHSQNEGFTNLFSQSVHDSLVMRDNTLQLVPGLAVSWQQVNATTWRFNLRRGVKFHDGSPFTADDVVFSFGFQHEGRLRKVLNKEGKRWDILVHGYFA